MKKIKLILSCLLTFMLIEGCTEVSNIFEGPVVSDVVTLELRSTPFINGTIAERSGVILLEFTKNIKKGSENITFNGQVVEPKFEGNTLTYEYVNLVFGTKCEFVVPSGAVVGLDGNSYSGTVINFTVKEYNAPDLKVFDAIVDKYGIEGGGVYNTVQAAIDAVPDDIQRQKPYRIFIKNGRYEELVFVSNKKRFVHLTGQDRDKVVFTYKINAAAQGKDGWEYSCDNATVFPTKPENESSATKIYAADFYAENITFENGYGVEFQKGPQAQALWNTNDRNAFYNCRFRSFQDTWYTKLGRSEYRLYVSNCIIEGAIDYFYGSGDAYISETTFYSSSNGYVLAPAQAQAAKYGYVLDYCTIDAATDVTSVYLGRPWAGYPKAVYLNTTIKATVPEDGWTNMGVVPILFAEYNTRDSNGVPVDLTKRKTTYKVGDNMISMGGSPILQDNEAALYTYENVIRGSDGWDPKAFFITESVNAPTNLTYKDGILTWEASTGAVGYIVISNDEVIGITSGTSFSGKISKGGIVKAVNQYGSLSNAAVYE